METDELSGPIHGYEPTVFHLESENWNVYYAAKRVMDIVVSSFLLVLLSPLMLMTAVMILLYDPGPVIFKQERVGAKRHQRGNLTFWEKENFRCYKFRTMKVNADSSVHRAYVRALIANDRDQMTALQGEATETRKLVHDPRITRPGMLLRKTSIDELPQLWNVLRGDISLVGPRPAIPYEVEFYKHWHHRRLEAQPGITGLQQVRARCAADFDDQVKLDLEYIDRQSLWLDIKIILMTPLAIVSTRGAK